jgi:hypothetical protein
MTCGSLLATKGTQQAAAEETTALAFFLSSLLLGGGSCGGAALPTRKRAHQRYRSDCLASASRRI